MHKRQTLVSLLHVSACHECHHQRVLSVANVTPSEWSAAHCVGTKHSHTHSYTHWNVLQNVSSVSDLEQKGHNRTAFVNFFLKNGIMKKTWTNQCYSTDTELGSTTQHNVAPNKSASFLEYRSTTSFLGGEDLGDIRWSWAVTIVTTSFISKNSYVLHTECSWVFSIVLRTISDYSPTPY